MRTLLILLLVVSCGKDNVNKKVTGAVLVLNSDHNIYESCRQVLTNGQTHLELKQNNVESSLFDCRTLEDDSNGK